MDECFACSSEHLKRQIPCDFQANATISRHAYTCGQQGTSNTERHLSGNRTRTMLPETKSWATPSGTTANPTITRTKKRTVWNCAILRNRLQRAMEENGTTCTAHGKAVSSARSTDNTKYALDQPAHKRINATDNQSSRCAYWVVERENNKLLCNCSCYVFRIPAL